MLVRIVKIAFNHRIVCASKLMTQVSGARDTKSFQLAALELTDTRASNSFTWNLTTNYASIGSPLVGFLWFLWRLVACSLLIHSFFSASSLFEGFFLPLRADWFERAPRWKGNDMEQPFDVGRVEEDESLSRADLLNYFNRFFIIFN